MENLEQLCGRYWLHEFLSTLPEPAKMIIRPRQKFIFEESKIVDLECPAEPILKEEAEIKATPPTKMKREARLIDKDRKRVKGEKEAFETLKKQTFETALCLQS